MTFGIEFKADGIDPVLVAPFRLIICGCDWWAINEGRVVFMDVFVVSTVNDVDVDDDDGDWPDWWWIDTG